MPCCTFERSPDAFHPVGIFFVCGAILCSSLPLAAPLLLLGLVSPLFARLGRRLVFAAGAARDVVARDFLHPRYRCGLSSRLLDTSPRLAGWAYRWLNVAAFALLWAFVLAAGLALAYLLP